MRRVYVAAAVMVLVGSVTTVGARAPSIPAGCPAISDLRSTAATAAPMTAERTASATLVAEGRAATRTMSGESLARGLALYEQAVRADPTNADAYVLLARMHAQSQRYRSVPKKLAQARAWEHLSKARALEPANIDGLHLLADLVVANSGDFRCARTILEAALALDPNNARSNFYYSQLLSGFGEFDRAFEYADKALAFAGDDATRSFVMTNAGRPRYMAGHYDWVLETYLASTPKAPLAHFYRSLAYGAKGRFQEALDEAEAYQAVDTARDAGGVGMIALAYANAGQKDKARELLGDLLRRDARGEHVVEYRIAAVYEALGDRNEAFRWLDKQIDDRDGLGSWLVWLKHDPVWAAARKDPRFREIERRAGW
jgi:tetratricopeptide (TPR) repeat protein